MKIAVAHSGWSMNGFRLCCRAAWIRSLLRFWNVSGGFAAFQARSTEIGPSVLSGYPPIVVFGVVILFGLRVVALVYREAFVSLWCVWAACSSLLVLLHMVRRRRLPDPHRLQGVPLVPQPI